MSNYRKTMTDALREMYSLDESVIDKVKEIDRKKSAKKIDGVMVDSFTASAISQVYDKVNDANKKKMDKLPIKKLADLAMKFIKHGEELVPEEVDLDEWKTLNANRRVSGGDKRRTENKNKKGSEIDEAQDGGDFKPHMMYDPKTGKGYKADTMDDHLRMKKMGYTHDAPKKEEVELDEDIMPLIFGGGIIAALLPVLFMSVREIIRGTPLESSIKKIVDKLKKNKNYKMSDSEKSDVKGFVSKVKKDKPSLLQKAMKKIKEEVEVDEQLAKIKGKTPADDGRRAATQDDIDRAEKKGDKKEVAKLKEDGLDEGKMKDLVIKGQDLEAYAKKSGGIDKKDMMNVAAMLKKGDKSGALKYAKKLDTDPRDYILDLMGEEVELDEAKQVLAHGGKGKYKVVNDGSGNIDVMFKGKSVGKGDYDRGAGSFFMSIKGEKGQKSFDDAQAIADYFAKNKITEEVDLDEASARADARRSMRRDPEMRQRAFSKDDSATDDDVKGASKNIMMQMRKAQSLNGRFDVEFADGKKVKIPAKMAIAVQSKYNKMRRPAEKEKFQAKIAKSYRDMLSALKEEVEPKKESVLDRIDRKIKEKNDG